MDDGPFRAADATIEDLHLAIQKAFGWDSDHLYSIFLSGQAWDRVTEVAIPLPAEDKPPTADEVLLADLELVKGQRFLYLFDYGDELRHIVQVTAVLSPDAAGPDPRVVAQHGTPPPQYGSWDDKDEDGGWDDEEDE